MHYPFETNPIHQDATEEEFRRAPRETVDLTDDRLLRVTRLRLVTDPGFPLWEVSYCHGQLKDGTYVNVRLPYHQFSRRKLRREIVEMAIEAGVHAKRLGMLDEEVISKLW
jgi:hypothetical protein